MSLWNEYTKTALLLKNSIPAHRYEHTLAVVRMVKLIAAKYHLDEKNCVIAALLHDCGREIAVNESVDFAVQHGLKPNKIEQCQPILLHAKIGEYLAKTKYGIYDKEILEAILYHSTGGKNMSTVAMAVYIADMLEESRDFAGVDELRQSVGSLTLQQLMIKCLTSTVSYLLATGGLIHLDSIKAYNNLISAEACPVV